MFTTLTHSEILISMWITLRDFDRILKVYLGGSLPCIVSYYFSKNMSLAICFLVFGSGVPDICCLPIYVISVLLISRCEKFD